MPLNGTGRTLVGIAGGGIGPVHQVHQGLPALRNAAGLEIILRSRERHTEVHPSVGRHGEGVLAALAVEQPGLSLAGAFLLSPSLGAPSRPAKHSLIELYGRLGRESVLERFDRSV